jgi:hypothetical protein
MIIDFCNVDSVFGPHKNLLHYRDYFLSDRIFNDLSSNCLWSFSPNPIFENNKIINLQLMRLLKEIPDINNTSISFRRIWSSKSEVFCLNSGNNSEIIWDESFFDIISKILITLSLPQSHRISYATRVLEIYAAGLCIKDNPSFAFKLLINAKSKLTLKHLIENNGVYKDVSWQQWGDNSSKIYAIIYLIKHFVLVHEISHIGEKIKTFCTGNKQSFEIALKAFRQRLNDPPSKNLPDIIGQDRKLFFNFTYTYKLSESVEFLHEAFADFCAICSMISEINVSPWFRYDRMNPQLAFETDDPKAAIEILAQQQYWRMLNLAMLAKGEHMPFEISRDEGFHNAWEAIACLFSVLNNLFVIKHNVRNIELCPLNDEEHDILSLRLRFRWFIYLSMVREYGGNQFTDKITSTSDGLFDISNSFIRLFDQALLNFNYEYILNIENKYKTLYSCGDVIDKSNLEELYLKCLDEDRFVLPR